MACLEHGEFPLNHDSRGERVRPLGDFWSLHFDTHFYEDVKFEEKLEFF